MNSQRSARLVLESGEVVAAGEHPAGARDLLLSRGLCRFRFFQAPVGLSRGLRDRAARFYAEAHAPFADTGMLLTRALDGAAIWYWDRARVGHVEDVRETSPESLWREPGEGWRIVACTEGYEAQYWEEGVLRASTWRRLAFSRQQWTAFALSVDSCAALPPEAPPAVEEPPLARGAWRRAIIRPPMGWKSAEAAAGTAALCAAGLAALFAAQALRFDHARAVETSRIAALEARLGDPQVRRALEESALVRDFVRATAAPAVLTASAEAHEALARHALRATSWRADARGFSAIVEAPGAAADVRALVGAIEAAPHLCGAAPEIASEGRIEIRASIVAKDAACAAQPTRGRR